MLTRVIEITDKSRPCKVSVTVHSNTLHNRVSLSILQAVCAGDLEISGDPRSPYFVYDWNENRAFFVPEDHQRVEVLQGGCE